MALKLRRRAEMITNGSLPQITGADSFKRVLGGCLKALKTRLLQKVRDDIVEIDDSPCQLKRSGLY